jgi:hypothetical protein
VAPIVVLLDTEGPQFRVVLLVKGNAVLREKTIQSRSHNVVVSVEHSTRWANVEVTGHPRGRLWLSFRSMGIATIPLLVVVVPSN